MKKLENFDAYLAELTNADVYFLVSSFVMNDVRNTSKMIYSVSALISFLFFCQIFWVTWSM